MWKLIKKPFIGLFFFLINEGLCECQPRVFTKFRMMALIPYVVYGKYDGHNLEVEQMKFKLKPLPKTTKHNLYNSINL